VQEALESSGALDDSQWLTYWLLSAIITIVERFTFRVLYYIPFYAEMKLAFLVWLALPPFNGASEMYQMARPALLEFYHAMQSTFKSLQGQAHSDDGAPCLLWPAP
jgi:receptor expression-enhancing protein 5/6